jgi:uncharacterized protein (TIGR02001 family)
MRKTLTAAAVAAALAAPTLAMAEDPIEFSANVGLFSDYLFRGISQTGTEPAIQGGLDLGYNLGPATLYVGTWASNVSWLEDLGAYTESSLEWDFYGGIKGNFGDTDFGYDVGLIYYYYPGTQGFGVNSADTTEIYAGLSWKWFGLKYSYALSDYFGFTDSFGGDTDGTWYLEFTAGYEFEGTGFKVYGSYGILEIDGSWAPAADPSYDTWKIGAAYTVPGGTFKDVELGLYYSDTSSIERPLYTVNGKDLSDGTVVGYIKKTF